MLTITNLLFFLSIYGVYKNFNKVVYYFLNLCVIIEDKINNIHNYFEKPIIFYSFRDFKKYSSFQNENMLVKIKHNNVTKYMITDKNIPLDTLILKKSILFSSVILKIDNQELDFTNIVNQFVINGHTINFNKEFAKILFFINKLNIEKYNFSKKMSWGIITNKIDIYNSELISFKINDDNLILYKE